MDGGPGLMLGLMASKLLSPPKQEVCESVRATPYPPTPHPLHCPASTAGNRTGRQRGRWAGSARSVHPSAPSPPPVPPVAWVARPSRPAPFRHFFGVGGRGGFGACVRKGMGRGPIPAPQLAQIAFAEAGNPNYIVGWEKAKVVAVPCCGGGRRLRRPSGADAPARVAAERGVQEAAGGGAAGAHAGGGGAEDSGPP